MTGLFPYYHLITYQHNVNTYNKELWCISVACFTLNSPKLSRPGSWNDPHLLKLIPERKKLSVKVADMEQNNFTTEETERQSVINSTFSEKNTWPKPYILCPHTTFHVRAWFQKDDPSSRLKSVPPMGAPKAAATPAAAPADTKSLLSLNT